MTASADFGVALEGLALLVGLASLAWVASLRCRDVSLVDRFWPVFIAGAALVYFVRLPAVSDRAGWMLALVLAWGLRLCLYVTGRNWGHGEDRRYQEIRRRNQPNFELKSLYLIFGLQVLLAWIVSAPFVVGMAGDRPLAVIDMLGIAVIAFGIVFEAVGDAQMSSFKADPAHAHQVMDRGLWRYTRHSNYFGEACVWWGVWLMSIGAGGLVGAWSVVSPLLMTVLLLKVSGVRLLEKDIGERRPAYRDYTERTNAFVPGPPRRKPLP